MGHTVTGVTFIALLFSFSTHFTFMMLASMMSFLAALLSLIAFGIDVALFVHLRSEMSKLTGIPERTVPGPGKLLCSSTQQHH